MWGVGLGDTFSGQNRILNCLWRTELWRNSKESDSHGNKLADKYGRGRKINRCFRLESCAHFFMKDRPMVQQQRFGLTTRSGRGRTPNCHIWQHIHLFIHTQLARRTQVLTSSVHQRSLCLVSLKSHCSGSSPMFIHPSHRFRFSKPLLAVQATSSSQSNPIQSSHHHIISSHLQSSPVQSSPIHWIPQSKHRIQASHHHIIKPRSIPSSSYRLIVTSSHHHTTFHSVIISSSHHAISSSSHRLIVSSSHRLIVSSSHHAIFSSSHQIPFQHITSHCTASNRPGLNRIAHIRKKKPSRHVRAKRKWLDEVRLERVGKGWEGLGKVEKMRLDRVGRKRWWWNLRKAVLTAFIVLFRACFPVGALPQFSSLLARGCIAAISCRSVHPATIETQVQKFLPHLSDRTFVFWETLSHTLNYATPFQQSKIQSLLSCLEWQLHLTATIVEDTATPCNEHWK